MEEQKTDMQLQDNIHGLSKAEKSCFDWLESLVTAVVVVVIVFTVFFRIPQVFGPSMLPGLEENDRVVVSCLERNFHQNDIVVVDARGTQLNERIIKRVIATEGQTVDIDFERGVVLVDGQELDESAYIENGITIDGADMQFPQTVPEGHIFVLGDNRRVSLDSRDSRVGMIDSRYVMGKVKLVLFPFSHFGIIN